jgi:Uma2 family endonuclease
MRWTIERYHKMVAAGMLDENDRVELIFGKLVDLSPVGTQHRRVVNKIMRLLTRTLPEAEYYVDVQNPVTLLDDSEPEPDICVARGPEERYANHHPYPADIFLLVEVSDTTLKYDRTAKMMVYAVASIPEYWVVNVYEKQIERYTQPITEEGNYASKEVYEAGERFSSLYLGDFTVTDLIV